MRETARDDGRKIKQKEHRREDAKEAVIQCPDYQKCEQEYTRNARAKRQSFGRSKERQRVRGAKERRKKKERKKEREKRGEKEQAQGN